MYVSSLNLGDLQSTAKTWWGYCVITGDGMVASGRIAKYGRNLPDGLEGSVTSS